MNSKTITILIALLFILAIPQAKVEASLFANKKEKSFCTTLPTTEAKLWAKVNARSAKRTTIIANHTKEFKTKWQATDAKIKNTRKDTDTKRSIVFENLYAKAKSEAQKQAVTLLEQAVRTATATYRNSVDEAIQTAQQSMQAVLNEKESPSELGQAITRARSACAIGRSDADAKSEFAKDVTAIVRTRINKKIPEALTAQIAQIRTTREQSIAAATTIYKKSLALAKDQFDRSFK